MIGQRSNDIRILHVITRMVRGGAQENTLATVAGINGGGWESALATGPALGPEGSLEPECLLAGVRMRRVSALVREVSLRCDLAALRQLTRLIRRERPHVLHTHTSKAGILGRVAARRAGVPVVVHTPHGHVFHSYEARLKTQLFVRLERACAGAADRLVALTDRERREHLDLGIGRPGQWVTVHSGIDFAPFQESRGSREAVRAELGLPADAVVLGSVGRLVPIKGHDYLLQALARLGARLPSLTVGAPLHLLLVGDGPLRDDLIARARSLGLRVSGSGSGSCPRSCSGSCSRRNAEGPTLHVLGLRRDVARLLAAMDLFTLPSLNEGMGRVLVEAMAMELPCVASGVSGVPDVVEDGVTGVLVPPRDPVALAGAIATLIEHPERAREMGRRGRRKVVPEFGVERMIEKLEAVYRELLEAKGIPVPPHRSAAWNGTLSRR
jgi:glycosyltransferase involved in cell wall biosynthesis